MKKVIRQKIIILYDIFFIGKTFFRHSLTFCNFITVISFALKGKVADLKQVMTEEEEYRKSFPKKTIMGLSLSLSGCGILSVAMMVILRYCTSMVL